MKGPGAAQPCNNAPFHSLSDTHTRSSMSDPPQLPPDLIWGAVPLSPAYAPTPTCLRWARTHFYWSTAWPSFSVDQEAPGPAAERQQQNGTLISQTATSCTYSQAHTHSHTHAHTDTQDKGNRTVSSHGASGAALVHSIRGQVTVLPPTPPIVSTPPHLPLTSFTTAGWTSGKPKLLWAPQKPQSMGPGPQTGLALPRQSLWFWGSVGTVAGVDFTGSEKAFGPKLS